MTPLLALVAAVACGRVKVCVYCGSSPGSDPAFAAAAAELGRRLVARGHSLVYGGGHVGLMGTVADAVLAAGGEVDGVIPQHLVDREIAHPGLTRLHVVGSMSERKTRMAELADAFVALPGGIGTLEELFETWTAGALGLHHKPVALLDVGTFFAPLLAMIESSVEHGFVSRPVADSLIVTTDPDELCDAFADYVPPPDRWAVPPSTPPPTKKDEPLEVVAWVLVRDGLVLHARSHGQPLFYLPGGKREPGENDTAALVREIREELGVELDATSLTHLTTVLAPAVGTAAGRTVRMACYAADPAAGAALPTPQGEIAELAWLSSRDRDRTPPADHLVMDQLTSRGLAR